MDSKKHPNATIYLKDILEMLMEKALRILIAQEED